MKSIYFTRGEWKLIFLQAKCRSLRLEVEEHAELRSKAGTSKKHWECTGHSGDFSVDILGYTGLYQVIYTQLY